MLNKDYLKALTLIKNTSSDLNKIYKQVKNSSFEDMKSCEAIEKLIYELNIFTSEINHYSKLAKEGYLNLGTNDRYSINDIELTCGYPLEIYNSELDQWEAGCVEHSSKFNGYYFNNYDGKNFPLISNMFCRIRS